MDVDMEMVAPPCKKVIYGPVLLLLLTTSNVKLKSHFLVRLFECISCVTNVFSYQSSFHFG